MPLKRTGFKVKPRKPLRRTKLRVAGKSAVSEVKQDIQDLLRAIAIVRDGGCVARDVPDHDCNGFNKEGELILQADHLIERSNSATYADHRLVVCVCKALHGWKHFKKSNHDQYNALIKTLISPERVALWESCEESSWRPVRTTAFDWKLAKVVLAQELRKLDAPPPS